MSNVETRTENATLGNIVVTLTKTVDNMGAIVYTSLVRDTVGAPVTIYTATGTAAAALAPLQNFLTEVNSLANSIQTAL